MAEEKKKVGRPKKKEPTTTNEKKEQITMTQTMTVQEPYTRIRSIFTKYADKGLNSNDFLSAMGQSFTNNPFIQNSRLKRINSPISPKEQEQVDKALENPAHHESLLCEESQALYFQNYVYNNLLKLNREVPQYFNYVVPTNVTKEDCNSEEFKREMHFVNEIIDKMNLRKVGKDIAMDVAIEGKRSYVFRSSYDRNKGTVDYALLQKLPSPWVKYTSIGSSTDYITSFDFMMFLQPGESVDFYPPFFREIWEDLIGERIIITDKNGNKQFNPTGLKNSSRKKDSFEIKDGRWFYWVELPQGEVFEFGSDNSHTLQLPDTIGLFSDLRGLNDYKWLQNQLLSKAVNSVLVGTVPLIKDHNLAGGDQTAISMDTIIGFSDMFSQAVSNNIMPFFAPFEDYDLLSLPLPPDAKEINNTALKNLINTSGMGALITTTDKPSIISVKTSQQLIESKSEYLMLQIQKAVNNIINNNLGLKYSYKVTIWGGLFTYLDQAKFLKELVMTGYTSLLPRLLSVFNQSVEDSDSVMNYLDSLGVYEKFMPMTVVTQQHNQKITTEAENERAKISQKTSTQLTKEQTEEITKTTTIGRPPVGDNIENDNTAISIDQGNNVSDIKD